MTKIAFWSRRYARSCRREGGFSLLEYAAVLALVAVGMVVILQAQSREADRQRAQVAAERLEEVTEAAKTYLRSNFTDLLAATAGGDVVAIPATGTGPSADLPSMQDDGALPGSFQDANGYGQTHVLLVRQPSANTLDAMITAVGGQAIPDKDLGYIAAQVGAAGGFMSSNPLPAQNGLVTGTYGGWRETAANWTTAGGIKPTPGRPQTTLAFAVQNLDTGAAASGQWLSRVDTGDPNDNTMQTAILMNGKDISGGGNVNTNTLQTTSIENDTGGSIDIGDNLNMNGSDISGVGTLTAAAVTTSGNITAGGNIGAAGAISAAGSISTPSAMQANSYMNSPRYYDLNNTAYYMDPNGTSNVNSMVVNGSITTTARSQAGVFRPAGVATSGSSCSGYLVGDVARDSSGGLLTCKSGVWTPAGGGGSLTRIEKSAFSAANGITSGGCPGGTPSNQSLACYHISSPGFVVATSTGGGNPGCKMMRYTGGSWYNWPNMMTGDGQENQNGDNGYSYSGGYTGVSAFFNAGEILVASCRVDYFVKAG